MSSFGIIINDNINRIFIQDDPSVPSTVINGVLLTKKTTICKKKTCSRLATVENYNEKLQVIRSASLT